MKIFDHPNMNGFTCPICNTSDDKPVTLIGIDGTQEDNIMRAHQYHIECIDLMEMNVTGQKFIVQVIK